MKIKRPTRNNVELGDLLVAEGCFFCSGLMLVPITEVKEKKIFAQSIDASVSVPYEEAVVLKRDGSYLIGERV